MTLGVFSKFWKYQNCCDDAPHFYIILCRLYSARLLGWPPCSQWYHHNSFFFPFWHFVGSLSSIWYQLLPLISLFMLSLIPVAVATNKEVEFSPVGDNIHRLNYGVIFKKDSTLVLSQEYWTHTFHLQLPNSIKPTNVSTRCNRNESHCYKWNDLDSVFQTLHVETQSHVKEVVKTIRSLIPQTNFPTKSSKNPQEQFCPLLALYQEVYLEQPL